MSPGGRPWPFYEPVLATLDIHPLLDIPATATDPAMTGYGWTDTKPFLWFIDNGTLGSNMHPALSAAARPASIDTRIANHVPAQPAPGIDNARDAALVAWCWAAIRRLPDQQRQVMEWTYRDGWSRQRCADELGVSESRISQIHTTACTAVRDLIAWRLGRPDPPAGPTQARRRHDYRTAVTADMRKRPRH